MERCVPSTLNVFTSWRLVPLLTRSISFVQKRCTYKYVEPTYIVNTGACSWTQSVRSVFLVVSMVWMELSIRRSHNFTSPLRLPDTSSLTPPRCICTLVIHCRCSLHTFTIAVVGLRRWSNTRTAPSPNPATKMFPAT